MTLKNKLTFFLFLCISPVGRLMALDQGALYPEALLKMDGFFSHHVLVAEKSTHLLHLFENDHGRPKLITSYPMVTGKKSGNKIFQGDHRTPEGIYFFNEFIPRKKLLEMFGKEGEIYGVGAFVTDYPNIVDKRDGKSGNGIWLHSTNDETRIDKGLDSRGCMVTANNDLKSVSEYIELGRTSVVIVQDIHYLKENAWKEMGGQIQMAIDKWLEAWKAENLEDYMDFYHPTEFQDSKGRFQQYKQYKKAVFSNPGRPEIALNDISILKSQNYAVATFRQTYRSHSINDTGKKTLYLKRDEYYAWKIIHEDWSKVEAPKANGPSVAFRPSMRFFSDNAQTAGN